MDPKSGKKQLTKINAIPLRGGVDKVRQRAQLLFGSFSDINNLRPMHPGFKQRKGMATKHTTNDGSNEGISLYQFAKGRRVEQHFFAQMSDGDVLKATDNPPTVTTGVFGAEIHDGTSSGMLPASWSTLADIMMYSNGVDQHQIYAGTNNYVHAFVKYDATATPGTIPTIGLDYTVQATDGRTTTEVVLDDLNTYALESNTTYDDEDMAVITDWTDNDTGDGASTQVTFDTKSCMKLDSGTLGSANTANRLQDIGTFGDRVTVELSIYCDAVGTLAAVDTSRFEARRNDVRLSVQFASDGLYITDGVAWNEVGTNLVVQDTWQKWVFDCDFSTPASATCDVYLDGVLKASDVDCSSTGAFTNGEILFVQNGNTTANQITYIDYFKCGDAQISSECLYIMTPVPATKLTWTFTAGWVNTAAAVGTLKYRKNDGTWYDTGETDGTIITAGKTLSGNGSMTWTAKTDEIPHYMFGRTGYWYQWETDTKLTDANGVRVTSLTYGHNSTDKFHSIENVWDGSLPYAIEVILYDYNDGTNVSYASLSPNDAEVDAMVFSAGGAGTDCDILYWNSWDKSWGIYVDVGDTPHNNATTTILAGDIEYWTGTAWASAGATITDGTNGFRNSGFITWIRNSEEPRQFNTGQYYSYWHRLWITGANLGADVRISIQTLPYFDINDFGRGVTNCTWKDRPTYTFDRYGHYIHVGATNRPMSLNGDDYGILMAGDGRHNKVLCQKKFKNELMVWQEELGLEGGCVTLFEGYNPGNYGKLVLSTKVGTFSAKSVEVIEGVLTSTKTDEVLTDLVFFLSRTGVCATDGKSIQVVSDQVQHHFDPTDTTNCIRYGYEKKMFLKYDSAYNGLRIGLVTGSSAAVCNTFLFFDLVDKVWMYDTLGQNISCMAEVEAESGNIPILQYGGGTNDGAVYRLNTGTNDIDIAAVTTPIDAYLTIEFGYEGLMLAIRELLLRMKVQSVGDCTVTPYTNTTAGTDLTLSMLAETSGDASRRHRTGLKLHGDSISLRFRNATASQEMFLYDVGVLVYELEGH
uniref:Uncharacterized protein n=2 Tax=viral metagenome TaxID=1070528 RepID=A0A6M3KEW3_9ZZZZ